MRARSFPEINSGDLDESGLAPRDGALAHAIVDAVCRHWLTLGCLLDRFTKQPTSELEYVMQGVLLCGAAQLVYMDRVPAHAVLDTSVEWAKRRIRPGAGGMVNAVLRRVAEAVGAGESRPRRPEWTNQRDELPMRDGSALVLNSPILPELVTHRMAAATSHPVGLLRRWVSQLGAEPAQLVAHHSMASAPVILNTEFARAPVPELTTSDDGDPVGCSPHSVPGCQVANSPGSWLAELLGSRGDVWVQDAASVLAIRSLADLRPRVVLDLCAGQGTKTRQLAATFADAEIWATDPDAGRFATLSMAFANSNHVRVVARAALTEATLARADLILLDVPCSNTGVLARRPEAKYRCGPEQLDRLVAIQRQIIADAMPLLAAGGSILYSTCSLDDDENSGVVNHAERAHDLKVSRSSRVLPGGPPGGEPSGYHDGAYSALLTKRS